MSKRFLPWDVDQVSLFPPSVSDYVPASHPAHFVRDLVRDELDLEAVYTSYGRLCLHAKIEGIPVAIDLAEKTIAFEIMPATMAENDFEYHPVQGHEPGDNDDELAAR